MNLPPPFSLRSDRLSHMTSSAAFAIAASLFLFSFSPARAGNLTLSTGPTVSLSNLTTSTITTPYSVSSFAFGSNTALKLSGDEIFNETASGSSTLTITYTGSGTVNAGDFVSLGYHFSIILTGTGTVVPTFNVTAAPFSANGTLATASPGTTNYQGSIVSATSPVSANINFTATATFAWTGGTANNKLEINVPTNSIDLAAAPTVVPEPSSWALLLLGAPLAFLCRSRLGFRS